MTKTIIAVMGGGMGGLAAAFMLSDTDELRERYEVLARNYPEPDID